MTRPMTWSLPASVVVSEPTDAISWSTVVPSPCNTWMISPESWLTSLGDRAWNSGWKPLNSWVRFSAGEVRASGIVAPGRSVSPTGPTPWSSST